MWSRMVARTALPSILHGRHRGSRLKRDFLAFCSFEPVVRFLAVRPTQAARCGRLALALGGDLATPTVALEWIGIWPRSLDCDAAPWTTNP
jgi:hypothetical protein